MTICLLTYAAIPLKFWSYAFTTATFLINCLPSSYLKNKATFEKLFHCLPNYKHLKVFGCACVPLLKPYATNKLQPKTS